MKKLILLATLATSLVPYASVNAGIFGRRWSRQAYPTYSYSQPAPQYAAAPTNQPAGYRSYSYQPEPLPNPDQPAEFQQFNPAYGYPTQQPRNETGEAYHDAGFKVRGF
jgi:hypothetical protein